MSLVVSTTEGAEGEGEGRGEASGGRVSGKGGGGRAQGEAERKESEAEVGGGEGDRRLWRGHGRLRAGTEEMCGWGCCEEAAEALAVRKSGRCRRQDGLPPGCWGMLSGARL